MTEPHAIDPILRQYLVQQFETAARCIGRAEHELRRLDDWLATAPGAGDRLYDDDLDRACLHTTRLIGAVASMQARQVASALALGRLGAAGAPTPSGGPGPNGRAKSDINPMPRENAGDDIAKSDANPLSLEKRESPPLKGEGTESAGYSASTKFD